MTRTWYGVQRWAPIARQWQLVRKTTNLRQAQSILRRLRESFTGSRYRLVVSGSKGWTAVPLRSILSAAIRKNRTPKKTGRGSTSTNRKGSTSSRVKGG